MQHAEDHVQLVHKLVRLHPQRVGVLRHAAETLQQLTDLGFIAEGRNGAHHLTLNDHRHGIHQQFTAVERDLPVAPRFAALQHLRQMQLRRPVFAGGIEQQVFKRSALAQQPFRLIIDDADA